MTLGKKMRALAVAGILGIGAFGPAHAITVEGNFFVDVVNSGVAPVPGVDGLATSISINDTFATQIKGNNGEGGGSYAFEFTSTQALTALETSTLNPTGGFLGATVQWNSLADGSGTVFGILTNAQILANVPLVVSFAANETKFLIASWDSIGKDLSNFDLRVEAVPVPPAVLLFGTALVGMGFLSRRRRRKNLSAT